MNEKQIKRIEELKTQFIALVKKIQGLETEISKFTTELVESDTFKQSLYEKRSNAQKSLEFWRQKYQMLVLDVLRTLDFIK